jgi:hypothetical protein
MPATNPPHPYPTYEWYTQGTYEKSLYSPKLLRFF